jgi:hypothetical protein
MELKHKATKQNDGTVTKLRAAAHPNTGSLNGDRERERYQVPKRGSNCAQQPSH